MRYPLDKMLALVLIGTMSGRVGYRSIARLGKQFEVQFSKLFELKHGLPSHVSLTTIIEAVDVLDFERAVNKWLVHRYQQLGRDAPVIAMDGKAIRSSIKGGNTKEQNFLCFVHAYCAEKELILTSKPGDNKTRNEINLVRGLIEELGMKGAIFTLDANHDSKKR